MFGVLKKKQKNSISLYRMKSNWWLLRQLPQTFVLQVLDLSDTSLSGALGLAVSCPNGSQHIIGFYRKDVWALHSFGQL